jgi:type I restriction enzyme S subunit
MNPKLPEDTIDLEVPDGWHKITLGELVTFHRGYDLPLKEKTEGKYPIVGSNGIIGYHNSYKIKGPGVTVGRSGNLGEPQFVEKDYWPHNTTLYVSKFHSSDPSFIYYFLKTLHLSEFNAGSAVPTLNRNHIHTIDVIVPKETAEQKAIGKSLSNLDSKIELNQQINKTLEAIAQAIFKRWFVDFEFPNEEGKPYKSSGGEMVHSEELGRDTPKDWHVGSISDLCSAITNGGTPKRAESNYWNGSIAWFKTGELTDGPLIGSEEHITEEGLKNSACKLWDENTILIALYGVTVGKLGILKIKAAANQACSGLFAKKEIGYPFLFYSLLFKRQELINFAVGAAQQNISQQIVQETKTIIPPTALLRDYNTMLNSLFDRQTALVLQNRTLTRIRDTLLPKLMSGKIRVLVTKEKVQVS